MSQQARSPNVKKSVTSIPRGSAAGGTRKENPAMSFVMLTESQVVPPLDSANKTPSPRRKEPDADQHLAEDNLFSEQAERAARLFEIISAHSDIDQPICVECTEMLVDGMQKRLAASTKERDMYVEQLRRANADIPSEEELKQARQELEKAKERERTAMAELEKLEAEKAAMEEELRTLKLRSLELDEKEEQFWAERNVFSQELAEAHNEHDAITRKYENDSKQLQRLQRANVYNDAFQISHDGNFGTINGLRLGRLPDKPVDWSEINAAWGNTCQLLATVAEKLGYKFEGFKLEPLGSKSKVIQLTYSKSNDPAHPPKVTEKVYELYSSGEYTLALGLLNRKFDNAMVVFLECLRQLIQYAETMTLTGQDGKEINPPKIPFKIEKDRIGDCSIRLGGFNQEEAWTKACKNVLISCKYLLAQASMMGDSRIK